MIIGYYPHKLEMLKALTQLANIQDMAWGMTLGAGHPHHRNSPGKARVARVARVTTASWIAFQNLPWHFQRMETFLCQIGIQKVARRSQIKLYESSGDQAE